MYDAEDDTPLASAEVWAGTTIIATTDANGAYSLLEVPAGDVTFTAIPPANASYTGMAVSVITQAKKIDFYIQNMLSIDQGTVAGQVTDSNGNTVEAASVIVHSRRTSDSVCSTRSSIYNTDSSGNYSYPYANEGKVAVSAGEIGVGNGYASEQSLSADTTLEANIQISDQGTITGNFSVPDSFTSWQLNQSPVGVLLSANYVISLPTYEVSSSSFNVSVPANTDCVVVLGVETPDHEKITGVTELGVSAEAGQTTSRNLTLYDVPVSASLVTAETYSTFSWEAPSSWTPDLYFVIGMFYSEGSYGACMFWYAFTDKTTVTVPRTMLVLPNTNLPLVYAMKTSEVVDFDAVDIANLVPTHYAGIKAEQ